MDALGEKIPTGVAVTHPDADFGSAASYEEFFWRHCSAARWKLKFGLHRQGVEDLEAEMSKEGILQDIKRRRYHEKPSVKRKRKMREARKRRRREAKRRVVR